MSSSAATSGAIPISPICNAEFFLGYVRRDAGILCTQNEGGKWQQYPFTAPDEALKLVERFKCERNIYVTMGTLKEGSTQRTAHDIASLAGFFVDLDCHGGEENYSSISEASDALQRFCKATAMPKPDYLVSSGHGLHAHWTFTDPLPRDMWQEVANQFKALMEAYGLKADPTVTADPARVLRVPCTFNFRDREAPVEVELLPIPSIAGPTTFSAFRDALDKALAKWGGAPIPKSRRPLSPLMSLVKSQSQEIPDTPENVELLRRMLDSLNPDCDYHPWRDAIWSVASTGLMAARDVASDWSKGGEKWDPKAFDRVWDSYDPHREGAIRFGTLVQKARDAGYDGDIPSAGSGHALAAAKLQARFRLLDREAIMAQPPLRWRVKGLFPETGIGATYGPSTSGKSFLAEDMGVHIALGEDWFGHRTAHCPVTYVMLEGESGLRNRVAAWEAHNGKTIPPEFRAMTQPFQLAEPDQVEELGAILPKGGVVIIDTLNRAAPGLDENSSLDMSKVLAGMKRLQEITGGLVLIVHHTGKDTSKGLRGHSSLLAALDGAIEVERTATTRSWSAAKVKDGEDGGQVMFQLHTVELGTDSDGDKIISCAVDRDKGAIYRPPPPKGKRQLQALEAVRKALSVSTEYGQAGADPQVACITFENALAAAAAAVVGVEAKRRVTRAREALDGLIEGKHLRRGLDDEQEEWVWV